MSNWYYVDTSGTTKGPVDEAELRRVYAAKTMIDSSYVWNGTTVNDWTPLSSVPSLHSKLKPKTSAAPKRPPSAAASGGGAPRRRSPMGGGGMASLLGDIRKGKTLKKAEPVADKPRPAAGGGGGGGRGGGGGGRALTMQEQMAAVLARRRSGGGGGGSGARGGGGARPSPVKKNPVQPKSPRGGTVSSAPKKSFGGSVSKSSAPKSSFSGSSAPRGGGGGASMSAMKSKIKGKLDRAEEWQLKAIAKILE